VRSPRYALSASAHPRCEKGRGYDNEVLHDESAAFADDRKFPSRTTHVVATFEF
jgi:hypothetical protein